MNEIKYKPLYGLQKPFDNGPADAEAYGFLHDCGVYAYYKIDKTSVYCFDTDNQWSHLDGAPTIPFLAMRRIIHEPKRWTVEDKKAGRLPGVGSEYIGRDVLLTCVFVDKNRDVWGKSKDNLMYCHDYSEIKPIETPDEKAARLREEWCIKALSSCSILSEMQKYELKRLGGYIEDIYDALLSGDLPVPGKGGE